MSPEDVLIEAIVIASTEGDSPRLRRDSCNKLKRSLRQYGMFYARDDAEPRRYVQATDD